MNADFSLSAFSALSEGELTEDLRYAVVKSSLNAEHFCVAVSGKLLDPELTSSERQCHDNLTTWFKRVLRFDVNLVSFSRHPFGKSAHHSVSYEWLQLDCIGKCEY